MVQSQLLSSLLPTAKQSDANLADGKVLIESGKNAGIWQDS